MASLPLESVLLDRDGTINVGAREGEYVTSPDDVRLLPGAAEAIAMLNLARVPVVIVTNQRGIALGRMTEQDLEQVHTRLKELLRLTGAHVDGILHCPHEMGTCLCRKPGTLLLKHAQSSLGLSSLEHSVMIGDSMTDVAAGRAAGARTVLLSRSDAVDEAVDESADSLLEAVQRMLAS